MTFALDLLNAPWAIVPERLRDIEAIYERRVVQGTEADIAAIEAATGKSLDNDRQGYAIDNGVAIVPLVGVLAKRANLFHAISGGASHQLFARDVAAAVADPRVDALLIEIDSPGGTVDGTPLAAAAVKAARESGKPVTVLADSCMCSAAYWIGAWGQEVLAADAVTQVGSIGVVARHLDTSRAEDARGLKFTEIVAGKYKRIASQHAPLTEEGRAAIQASVDGIYAEFVDAVAQARGRSVEQVLADMADGRVFMAREAAKAGLVDGIATRAEAMARLRNRVALQGRRRGISSTRPIAADSQEPHMQVLSTEASSLPVEQIVTALADHAPSVHAAIAGPAREAGAKAERERIQAVRAQALAGHEALIEQLAFDGKTTGPEAAVAVLNAERAAAAKRKADLAADTPPPLAHDASATGDAPAAEKKPAAKDPLADAQTLASAIAKVQAEHAATGRNLSAVQALAIVNQQEA